MITGVNPVANGIVPFPYGAFKTYTDVEQIGLTRASATVSDVWSALPDASQLICDAAYLSSDAVPYSQGTINVVRFTVSRGYILLFAKTSDNSDYRMHLAFWDNVPDGTWVKLGS